MSIQPIDSDQIRTVTGNDLCLFDRADDQGVGLRVTVDRVDQAGRQGLEDIDDVGTGSACDQDRIEVSTAVERVVAVATDHGVFAGPTVDRLIVGSADDGVIAGITVGGVECTAEMIIANTTIQR